MSQPADTPNFKDATVCEVQKNVHDVCFFNWYQDEFLKGSDKPPEACTELWDTYQVCLKVSRCGGEMDAFNLVRRVSWMPGD